MPFAFPREPRGCTKLSKVSLCSCPDAVLAPLLMIRWRVAHQQMKTISCLMWMLVTLLITATLDRVPDPPAANPAGAQLTVSGPHELTPAFGAPTVGSAPSQMQEHGRLAIPDSAEPLQSTKWIDALERGTDPSPPLLVL